MVQFSGSRSDQLSLLIRSASPGRNQTELATFTMTGIRHGELLGLMWRDLILIRLKSPYAVIGRKCI